MENNLSIRYNNLEMLKRTVDEMMNDIPYGGQGSRGYHILGCTA